jgi:hypothetical protein
VFPVFVVGCATRGHSQLDRPAVKLQLQNSVTLAACRYAAIFQAVESGSTHAVMSDLDWWIDQAIIELQMIEERYPLGSWETVQAPHVPDPEFQMRILYRAIARFRRDHPRRHSVPLDEGSLKRISDFVQKYQ